MSVGEAADNAKHAQDAAQLAASPSFGALAAITGTGALAAIVMVAALGSDVSGAPPGSQVIDVVQTAEIDQARVSLDAAVAAGLTAEAKSCKAPLAYVTLATSAPAAANAPATVRIRSGNYLSPTFVVSPVPQRVAIPFPAPFPTGQGVLTIEGQAQGLGVALAPVWRTDNLPGRATINVWWNAKARPC